MPDENQNEVVAQAVSAAAADPPDYRGRPARVLKYIIEHKIAHDGNSPTLRQIGNACDISSTSVVNYTLNKLVKAKLIRIDRSFTSRYIEVVGGKWLPSGVEG